MSRVANIFMCIKTEKPSQGILKTGPEYQSWDGPVIVFFHNPSKVYEEIGIVSTRASSNQPMSALIASLQEKAASIGANGIIVQSPGISIKTVMGQGVEMYERHLKATAIRIK